MLKNLSRSVINILCLTGVQLMTGTQVKLDNGSAPPSSNVDQRHACKVGSVSR